MKVELSEQVIDFVRRLAPEPRRRVRLGLKGLSRNKGDIKPLEGPLQGYMRLRVHGYRIIFSYHGKSVQCIFAERRGIVYEVLEHMLREALSDKPRS